MISQKNSNDDHLSLGVGNSASIHDKDPSYPISHTQIQGTVLSSKPKHEELINKLYEQEINKSIALKPISLRNNINHFHSEQNLDLVLNSTETPSKTLESHNIKQESLFFASGVHPSFWKNIHVLASWGDLTVKITMKTPEKIRATVAHVSLQKI